MVLGGYADFKTNVIENDIFDCRLKPIVLKVVDISYGMEQGFNQAIELSQECFKNVRLVKEQNMIKKFMENITLDTGMVVFGVKETLKCMDDLAVDTLIVHDNLDYQIVELKPVDQKDGKETIKKYLKLKDVEYESTWTDKETKIVYNIQDYESLVDWLGENYKKFKCNLFYISDLSPEGHQFVHGFSGVGGLLKFKVQTDDNYYSEDEYEIDDFI